MRTFACRPSRSQDDRAESKVSIGFGRAHKLLLGHVFPSNHTVNVHTWIHGALYLDGQYSESNPAIANTGLASDLDLVVILQELFQVGVGDLLSFGHYDRRGSVSWCWMSLVVFLVIR
jgi:hypothetical protein